MFLKWQIPHKYVCLTKFDNISKYESQKILSTLSYCRNIYNKKKKFQNNKEFETEFFLNEILIVFQKVTKFHHKKLLVWWGEKDNENFTPKHTIPLKKEQFTMLVWSYQN